MAASAAPRCPLCDSDNSSVYFDERDAASVAAAAGAVALELPRGEILKCHTCGLGYRPNRPDDSVLAALYTDLDERLYESEQTGRQRTARRNLAIVERFVRPGRLLDVGCASGTFIAAAQDRGWQVCGIEPSASLHAKAVAALGGHGLVHNALFHEVELPAESVDVLTAWDVLEHVSHPVRFMSRCRTLVRPGGFVFANVPDLSSFQARVFGKRWPLLLSSHLWYFGRDSLRLCAQRSGLEVVEFGRRPAWFTLRYLLFRLSQHGIPGSRMLSRMLPHDSSGALLLPLPMGEVYMVCRRPPAA